MQIAIIIKAKYYYDSGLVFLEKVTQKGIYFKVGLEGVSVPSDGDAEKLVSFVNNGKGFVPSCTCKHASNQGTVYGCLCSHIIACLIYLYHKKGKLDVRKLGL